MEVLDDFFEEASEVHEHNPWLEYIAIVSIARNGIPQKNIRHYGRKTFTHVEMRAYCSLLLVDSSPLDELPDPGTACYAKIYLRIPCF